MSEYTEYTTKLDSYYYDEKLSTTTVVLKIRNKRAVCHLSIQDVLHHKEVLSTLHPIDLCIIGVLANTNPLDIKNDKHNPALVLDNYLMDSTQPNLRRDVRRRLG